MKRAYAYTPEGQVHYRTEGIGSPLLLLHQSVCSSDEYSDMIPILSKSYQVIAMDTLGYGDSDKPQRVYDIPDYARSVASFLDSLGINKTSVVGHHTGATIAVEVAATYPDRVDKLVLSGCGLDKKRNAEIFPRYAEWFDTMKIDLDGSFLMRLWEKTKGYSPRGPVELLYAITLEYLKAGRRGEEAHWAAQCFDARSRLPLIKCPTLVISGRNDIFLPVVEEVKSLIPHSRSLIIEGPGTGPAIIRKKSKAIAEAVLNFLQNPL